VQDTERAWEAHLGAARFRQLRQLLESLAEITDPFAES